MKIQEMINILSDADEKIPFGSSDEMINLSSIKRKIKEENEKIQKTYNKKYIFVLDYELKDRCFYIFMKKKMLFKYKWITVKDDEPNSFVNLNRRRGFYNFSYPIEYIIKKFENNEKYRKMRVK